MAGPTAQAAAPSIGAGNANQYLAKHQLDADRVTPPPAADLGLVVVVPCLDEPGLLYTVSQLWRAQPPACAVEVLVVINHSELADAGVKQRNLATLGELERWAVAHQRPGFRCHAMWCPDLPRKHAGVGLARKLGMDEAVSRFCQAGVDDGVIVALDADCGCRSDYLSAIEDHFQRHPATPGCSIRFEHPLDGTDPAMDYAGIARYELFLRYYHGAVRYTGYPYACHAVGSAMAVRSSVYQRQGGMNRRQAGEDFYFVNKICRLAGYTQLDSTVVYPSARHSNRVPFGTGVYLSERRGGHDRHRLVYPPAVFEDLKVLFDRVPALCGHNSPRAVVAPRLSPALLRFLEARGFEAKLAEINANTASAGTFVARFFHWFDAFLIYKYVRSVHAHPEPGVALETAVDWLLERMCVDPGDTHDIRSKLCLLRRLERHAATD